MEEEDEAVTGILTSLLCKTRSSAVKVGKITLPEEKLRPAAEVNHSLWIRDICFAFLQRLVLIGSGWKGVWGKLYVACPGITGCSGHSCLLLPVSLQLFLKSVEKHIGSVWPWLLFSLNFSRPWEILLASCLWSLWDQWLFYKSMKP